VARIRRAAHEAATPSTVKDTPMRFEFAAAALATAVLGSPLTHAADVNQDALSPQQRLHQAQADMRQVAQKGQSGMYKLDIEPPQLTSFAAATSLASAASISRRNR
jgi:hypothetical protein